MLNGSSGTQWKSTTLLLGTAAFVGAAAAVWLLLLEGNGWSTWVSGVLGAVALAGLTFSILVLGSDEADALVYVTGLLMLAGGAAGFWFLKGQLYTVVAVFGGLLVLGQIFSDTLDSGADEGDALSVGIAFLFYGLVVAAAGWFFSCRRLLGVIGLFIGGFAMLAVMLVNAAALALAVAFSDPALAGNDFGGPSSDSVRSDIRVALLLGLLVVIWLRWLTRTTASSGSRCWPSWARCCSRSWPCTPGAPTTRCAGQSGSPSSPPSGSR